MRPHDIRARRALHASKETAPLFPGAAQVLRQATLQVHKRDVRKPASGTAAHASTQLNVH